MEGFVHVSILLDECIRQLEIKPCGIYVDATLGGAGHSGEILKRLSDGGRLICLDKDDMALENGRQTLCDRRVTLIKSDFREIDKALQAAEIPAVDGILFDLGVSSPQLDMAERGFSYQKDAPLDMRMDRQQSLTAYDVVNTYDRDRLRDILYQYGEEKFAPRIADAIVRNRETKPVETTAELSDLIRAAMPQKALLEKQHPAKRSFQAIRIAVNDELKAVEEAMDKSIDLLKPGGKLCVITFHSLEDRIVKQAFAKAARGCECPRDFPVCVCGKTPRVEVLRKPVLPGESEIEANPRARSAKLRVCRKL